MCRCEGSCWANLQGVKGPRPLEENLYSELQDREQMQDSFRDHENLELQECVQYWMQNCDRSMQKDGGSYVCAVLRQAFLRQTYGRGASPETGYI